MKIQPKNIHFNNAICRTVAIYITLAVLCLFIPWLLPVQEVRSESYALGFSNKAFLVCLLFLFMGPIFFDFRFARGLLWDGFFEARNEELADYTATAGWLRKAGALFFTVCVIFLLVNYRNLTGFGEAEYFLLSSALIEAGKVPYKDFEYAYGPFMIYSIFILKKLGSSAGFALAILVIAESIIGYLSIYFVTSTLFGKQKSAGRLIFFSLFLSTCVSALIAGQNYTFFRFALPLAFGCWFLIKLNSWRIETCGLLSGLVFLLGWIISPEVGIAGGVAFSITVIMLSKHYIICFHKVSSIFFNRKVTMLYYYISQLFL